MKEIILLALFSFSALIATSQVTIVSDQNGDWDDPSTWDLGRIPNASDHALIQHEVSLTDLGDLNIDELDINNGAGVNAYLNINSNTRLFIAQDILLESNNQNAHADIILTSNAELHVTTDVTISRSIFNNNNTSSASKQYGSSKFYIGGSLNVFLNGVSIQDDYPELVLAGSSYLEIGVNTIIYNGSANSFYWTVSGTASVLCRGELDVTLGGGHTLVMDIGTGASFEVQENALIDDKSLFDRMMTINVSGVMDFKKDLTIKSSYDNNVIAFNVSGMGSEVYVGGDLEIDGGKDQDIFMSLTDNAKFYLAGNFNRVGDFGVLSMSNNSTWVYNGTSVQNIPRTEGANLDKLSFTNIEFISDADSMVLEGDLEIDGSFTLTKGILKTSNSAMLIINDGATISAGSEFAFIDGPIKKISTTNIEEFIFPVGDQGVYAPFKISKIDGRAAGGEYTAQYYNCPPPWEVSAPNLTQYSNSEFWGLDRSAGSADVNVTLYWTDAAAQGITNTDSLVVAMYNDPLNANPMFPTGWTSIGNGGVVCDAPGCESGNISNIGTCPPPWEVSKFTFGSTDGSNALPLNMESFDAELNGLIVDINWVTSAELNADHFIIEKSRNGIDFIPMTKVAAKALADESAAYADKDMNPYPGNNYYRLKQVDVDGMFAYTAIVVINFQEELEVTIFPNPFTDYFVVKGDLLDRAEHIRIMDNSGRVIMSQAVDTNDGFLEFESTLSNISRPGLYLLEINTKTGSELIRIMKTE